MCTCSITRILGFLSEVRWPFYLEPTLDKYADNYCLLWTPNRRHCVGMNKYFNIGFSSIQNFKAIFWHFLPLKSVATITQKLVNQSVWQFTHFFYIYLTPSQRSPFVYFLLLIDPTAIKWRLFYAKNRTFTLKDR